MKDRKITFDLKWPPTERELIIRNTQIIADEIPEDHSELLASIERHSWLNQSVAMIAASNDLSIYVCRRMLFNLRQQGLIKLHVWVREDENLLAGSGYALSDMGRRVLRKLGKMKDW